MYVRSVLVVHEIRRFIADLFKVRHVKEAVPHMTQVEFLKLRVLLQVVPSATTQFSSICVCTLNAHNTAVS